MGHVIPVEAEASLTEAADMFEFMDATAIVDDAGFLVRVNQAFLDMFGCNARADVLGQSLGDLFFPGTGQSGPEQSLAVGETWRGILFGRAMDGAAVPAEVTVRVAPGGRRLWAFRSATEGLKVQRRARVRMLEQAEVAARLADIDRMKREFVSNVSHELRTPLAAITAYAEFLEEALESPEPRDSALYVHEIQVAARHLQEIIDDLLDFSIHERSKVKLSVEEIDLTSLVEGACATWGDRARDAGIVLERGCTDAPISVAADPRHMGHVVRHLLSNAIKFTPRGGRVRVEERRVGDEAWITVTDTGIGVSDPQLERVFDAFYQVDGSSTRARGGLGLGLAVCRALVLAHHGRIEIQSRPGEGSCFKVVLPAA
jgi:PAS domain S-box-containing protein